MKKLTILTSVLALAACGSGSGGGGVPVASNNNTSALGNVELPTSRVSSTAETSNRSVTGMDSSVTNISEMTAAVESAIGTDALNSIASDSDNISSVINRSASARHATLRAPGHHTDKEKGAYLFLEGGKRFKNWGHDKRRDFYRDQPDMVRYWGRVHCNCDVDSFTEDQLLAIFDNDSNQANWNNFYEQNHYREYTLENVEFTMAAASGGHGDEGGSKDILTFELDNNGQINAVNHVALVKSGNVLVESAGESATFSRNNDADNTFSVGQLNGEGKYYTGNGVILTYGNEIGLKYSDFGQLKYDLIAHYSNGTTKPEYSYEPFAGGYKELRKDLPETDMTFTGKAAGSVSNGDVTKNITGNADLAFNAGKETLHMDFSNTVASEEDTPWYDVTIVRNQTANTNSISFTTSDELNESIPDNLKFNDFTGNTRTKNNYLVDGYNGQKYPNNRADKGKLDIGYYGGIDGNVTEATGVTQYVESNQNGEIRMNVGFGGTRQ